MSHDIAVVIGQYPDGSGISTEAYGPFWRTAAERIAEDLTGGHWQSMHWVALPIGLIPGQCEQTFTSRS